MAQHNHLQIQDTDGGGGVCLLIIKNLVKVFQKSTGSFRVFEMLSLGIIFFDYGYHGFGTSAFKTGYL